MRKISPSFFKGITFIRISNLPRIQHQELLEWLSPTSIINIKVNGVILEDCLQYKDYEYWYENQFVDKELSMVGIEEEL